MNQRNCFVFFIALLTFSCRTSNINNEILQHERSHEIGIGHTIKDFNTNYFFGLSSLAIVDSILIVNELQQHSSGKSIHLFNKNTFNYIASAGIVGKGPSEITRPGRLAVDAATRTIYLSDYARNLLWIIPIDSALSSSSYLPTRSIKLDSRLEFTYFSVVNDTVLLGKSVSPLSNSSYEMLTSKLHVVSSMMQPFGYEHPESKGRWLSNSHFTLSLEHNLYACAYNHIDLITICNLNGSLVANICGPGWGKTKFNANLFFKETQFTSKYIFATYLGGEWFKYDSSQRPVSIAPTKILQFDISGNYIRTLETENPIVAFCIDEENNKVIAYVDGRENPLVHFSLELNSN